MFVALNAKYALIGEYISRKIRVCGSRSTLKLDLPAVTVILFAHRQDAKPDRIDCAFKDSSFWFIQIGTTNILHPEKKKRKKKEAFNKWGVTIHNVSRSKIEESWL